MAKQILLVFTVMSLLVAGCATPKHQVKVTEKTAEKPVVVEQQRMDITTVISKLSEQISSTMLAMNTRRVAVMNFPLLTGEMTELGMYLSDKLTNSLFTYRDKFEVVERAKLETVFKEMKLGLTGLIDDKTAQTLGKIFGADAIVVGTITDLGEEIDINLRVLGTERANVLAVASVMLDKNTAIERMISSVRVIEPKAKPSSGKETHVEAKAKPVPPSNKLDGEVEAEGFLFRPIGCERDGKKMVCSVSITNKGETTKQLKFRGGSKEGQSFMIDNFGNKYYTNIGNSWSYFLNQNFIPQLPLNVNFISKEVVNVKAIHMTVVIRILEFSDLVAVRSIPIKK